MKRASCIKVRNKGTADQVLYNEAGGWRGVGGELAFQKRKPLDGDTPSSLTQLRIGGNNPTVFRNPFTFFVFCFFFISSSSFDVFITAWQTIPAKRKRNPSAPSYLLPCVSSLFIPSSLCNSHILLPSLINASVLLSSFPPSLSALWAPRHCAPCHFCLKVFKTIQICICAPAFDAVPSPTPTSWSSAAPVKRMEEEVTSSWLAALTIDPPDVCACVCLTFSQI